jgi:hypothetical protein
MKCKCSLLFLSLVVVLGLAATIGMGCEGDRVSDPIDESKPNPKYVWCAIGCNAAMTGNGRCDTACNVEECNYDEGDCVNTTKPTPTPTTPPTPTPTIAQCADYCFITWIGDGQCDFACYNAECNWDGGDCGTPTAAPTNAMSGYCSDRCMWEWVGDGQCDYEWHCYTATCNWDSGDCRSYYNECSLGCPWSQISNGTCEPTCNNAACNYDGGDCH